MKNSRWSEPEVEYLKDKIGMMTFKNIGKKLGRTETAVKIKAKRLNLGGYFNNSDLISTTQAAEILGIDRRMVGRYYKDRGVLVPKKTVNNHGRLFYLYDINEVYKFKQDYQKQNNKRWSEHEISRLKMLLKRGYTYKKIGECLNRSAVAIEHKCKKLRI